MKKNLVIVESPAKAKTLGRILGKEYNLKASMGHIRDLPKGAIGVDIANCKQIMAFLVFESKRIFR